MELVIIMILTLLLVPLVLFTEGVLRIALSLLFILFIPGYILIATLFPKKDSLDSIARIALSFILSAAFAPLIGLVLNYTPWGIRLYPIMVSYASFIFIASIIALYRRQSLPKGQRLDFHLHIRITGWTEGRTLDKALSVILVLSIVGAIGTLAYVFVKPKAEERFTEFYILGSEHATEDYPQELVLGEQEVVILGIINHEHCDISYHVEVRIDNKVVQEIGDIPLPQEQKWEGEATLVPIEVGEGQEVDFLLYKGELSEPYRELHLYINVEEAK